MATNLVLNNSDRTFSTIDDQIRASFDQTSVVATPGSAAAVLDQRRAELETGTLTASGKGVHLERTA
jgi:hypothetical protein